MRGIIFYMAVYSEFYKDLIPYMIEHTSLKIWHTKLESAYKDWTRTGFFNLRVEDKNFISWQIIHSMMVIVQITKVLPEIINTVSTFLKLYYNIPEELINDYTVLTTERIKTWDNYKVTPKKISTFTNLWEYTQNTDEEIEFLSHEYFVKDRFNHFPEDFSQHLDNIIYGRRRNWILNLIDDRI